VASQRGGCKGDDANFQWSPQLFHVKIQGKMSPPRGQWSVATPGSSIFNTRPVGEVKNERRFGVFGISWSETTYLATSSTTPAVHDVACQGKFVAVPCYMSEPFELSFPYY